MADLGNGLTPSKRTVSMTEHYHGPAKGQPPQGQPPQQQPQPQPQGQMGDQQQQTPAVPQLPDHLVEIILANLGAISSEDLRLIAPALISTMIQRHLSVAGLKRYIEPAPLPQKGKA
jgi:hypothetical protein